MVDGIGTAKLDTTMAAGREREVALEQGDSRKWLITFKARLVN